MLSLKRLVLVNLSPCVIPSPPMSGAFSLVRKVQGRLPAAGEASMGLQCMGKSSPVPQPASSTKQKKKRLLYSFPVEGGTVNFYAPKKEAFTEKKRLTKLKQEIVKEVAIQIENERIEGTYDEELVRKAARLAIDLWEKRK